MNVSGEEGKDVIYQPVYKVKGLTGATYEITADEDVVTPDGTLRYQKEMLLIRSQQMKKVLQRARSFIWVNIP